jgi:GSH-dependent disulfide-bond oxidoreductase
MIELYYWPTPNGHKVTLFLEEAGLAYTVVPVNIGAGDQFKPDFLAIAPNNRMPAIVDHEPGEGGEPISVFESGAILEYLADKTGKFLPDTGRARYDVLQWLYWQMGGLGPMFGQLSHFTNYAPKLVDGDMSKVQYGIDRYSKEADRLLGVLEDQLDGKDFMCGDYSIADMACYPWVSAAERLGKSLEDFPHIRRWIETIRERPATTRAYDVAKTMPPTQPPTPEQAKILFSQGRIRKGTA